jgi:hypothetical protein
MQRLMGAEISAVVALSCDWAEEVAALIANKKSAKESSSSASSAASLSSKQQRRLNFDVAFLHFSFIFEGVQIRVASFDATDAVVLFSSGACRYDLIGRR